MKRKYSSINKIDRSYISNHKRRKYQLGSYTEGQTPGSLRSHNLNNSGTSTLVGRRSSTSSIRSDVTPTPASRIAGAVVGAGVNFLMGNEGNVIPAGISGAVNGLWSSSQKNMSTKNKVTNVRIDKSSMKKTGKAIVKRQKKVKVSPYLTKAVKQVMQGQQAVGFYQRSIAGLIGSCLSTTTSDVSLTASQMGIPGQISAYFGGRGTGQSAGMKSWWSVLALAQQGPTRGSAQTIAHTDLNFFTPGKIWHAASVLFNNKTEVQDPYSLPENNLKVQFNPTDGNVSNSITSNGLKINVLHSKVDVQIKNISARTIEVDLYICTPKHKFNINGPMNDLFQVSKEVGDNNTAVTGTDRTLGWYSDGIVKNPQAVSFITEGTIDAPAILKNNGWQWDYEKCTMVLASQEVCKMTVKGPSGVFDFKKNMNPVTSNTIHLLGTKNWSKHFLFSVRPDNVGTTVTAASTVNDYGGRLLPLISGETVALLNPISIECEESYRIAVPEIAGFQTVGIGAGAATPSVAQALNFRKPKIQITTIYPTNPGFAATQSIISSNEESPADPIPSSLQ